MYYVKKCIHAARLSGAINNADMSDDCYLLQIHAGSEHLDVNNKIYLIYNYYAIVLYI